MEERRQQLIAVTLDLFSRHSPDEVSIDDIAAAAGVSRPLVYHYFPGKHGLHEIALHCAARELAARFVEPHEGPLGTRLLRVLGRFFDFVADHSPGFAALLRGSVAGSDRVAAVVDEVRQTAYEQVLSHLGVTAPGPRLALVVRSWVGLAETTALTWLKSREIAHEELAMRMVHDFGALLAVTAVNDTETREVVRRLMQEPSDSPFGELLIDLAELQGQSDRGPAA